MARPTRRSPQDKRLSSALNRKLQIRGKGLDSRLRKAKTRLPRGLKSDADLLLDAGRTDRHPKLDLLTDHVAINKAQNRLMSHLDGIDTSERRKNAVLGVLGSMVFNLLILAGLVTAAILWLG